MLQFQIMILKELEVHDIKEAKHKNYSLIAANKEKPLFKYINSNDEIEEENNINKYLKINLDNCEEKITDENSYVLELLNNKEIKEDLKEMYINYLGTKINRLSLVDDLEFWSKLLLKNVDYSEENILDYFFKVAESKIDENLREFINLDFKQLAFNEINFIEEYGEKSNEIFYHGIICCNELKTEIYLEILRYFSYKEDSFSIQGLSEEKIRILIKRDIIEMSEENLNFIRKEYQNNLIFFIIKNIEIYINEIIDKDNYLEKEIFELLEACIKDDYKIKLLKIYKKPISIIEKNYSKVLEIYILNNYLEKSDLEFLIKNYHGKEAGVKEAIIKVLCDNLSDIIKKGYKIDENLVIELLERLKNNDDKNDLFLYISDNLKDKREVENLLIFLEEGESYIKLLNGKNPSFKLNESRY